MLATVITGAVKVEMLPQLLLTISRQVEEVHIADSQLLPLLDRPYGSQLDPDSINNRDNQINCYFMYHQCKLCLIVEKQS